MDDRILVLAPHGRDAPVICETLTAVGEDCVICPDLLSLAEALSNGAGTAILTEEALAGHGMDAVSAWLETQPAWSDFPFIVLVTSRTGRRARAATARLEALGNTVLLERPINAETLASAGVSALRGRRRQYATRRHIAEQASSEDKLRFALDSAGLGAWELELDQLTLTASETARVHFGQPTVGEVEFFNVLAVIHPDDVAAQATEISDAMAANRDIEAEFRVTRPDGEISWLQVRGRVVPRPGSIRGVVSGVTMDITLRKAREQEFVRLNDALQSRVVEGTEQLQEANRMLIAEIKEREQAQEALVQAQKMEAIGQLTGGIAHDFNNLLTAIVGNVDMIERRSTDERITRMAGYARQAADRATRLTGQLLAFSRSQQLDLQPIRVDEMIQGMNDLLTRALGHTVTVETNLNAGNTRATADATQLELAVLNLAINARDAMDDGGVLTIATRISEEWIEPLQPRPHLVLSVSDSGHGIPAELLKKVFDPFFTTKGVGRGTGLGLSQVYGIATQSGGTVRVTSTVGEGTTVEIWLPVDTTGEMASVSLADGHAPVGHGETILVVDDDPDVRQFIVGCLASLGYAVTQADTGMAGVERLKHEIFELAVVDFAMPGMTGTELALQAKRLHPNLPVLLVTGYADADAIQELTQTDAVLRKPFKVAELAHAVAKSLQQPRA